LKIFLTLDYVRYYGRLGVVVGEVEVLLKVRILEGRTFSYSPHGKVTVEKKV
jgi:hypothetical protein